MCVESNEQNKLNSGDRLMDTENRLTAVRGEGVAGWVRRVKGLRKIKTKKKDLWTQAMVR